MRPGQTIRTVQGLHADAQVGGVGGGVAVGGQVHAGGGHTPSGVHGQHLIAHLRAREQERRDVSPSTVQLRLLACITELMGVPRLPHRHTVAGT